jgi:hypothetical protein
MDRETLVNSTLGLAAELYRPERYQRRVLNLIDTYAEASPLPVGRPPRRGRGRAKMLETLRRISARGRAEAGMVDHVMREASRKPVVFPAVVHTLFLYEQARHVLDYSAHAR